MEQNQEKFSKSTSEKNYFWPIMIFSAVAVVIILLLFFSPIGYQGKVHFDLTILPRMNAIFNSFTFVFFINCTLGDRCKEKCETSPWLHFGRFHFYPFLSRHLFELSLPLF
ncbi:hypothetical protein MAQA_01582 [Listeria aquatica FSL S10-1188]|uniref:Uncharacterized protein n=1 Tax=Listeria aquatica FSL S10-1188 TaxID=1265818 RepID=W7BN17_9LIST|nr:hypothetical protein MAQA_01582 [Listeria aquatica FSL S10-1188]